MGRWAQYRKRGAVRELAAEPAFPLPPPVINTEWSVDSNSDTIFGISVTSCPAPADNMEFRFRIAATPPWLFTGSADCNTSMAGAGCVNGSNYEVEARWRTGATPVSDWSIMAGPFECAS